MLSKAEKLHAKEEKTAEIVAKKKARVEEKAEKEAEKKAKVEAKEAKKEAKEVRAHGRPHALLYMFQCVARRALIVATSWHPFAGEST